LHELITLIEEKTVSGTGAKSVFEEMYKTGKAPREIVQEQGLTQISSSDELTGLVAKVIEANPKPVADYRGGKESALKALVGLVMRETRGRANPQLAEELLRQQLDQG
jgi:aspartyl-tRNA(Asn)/glutamyl-tRNA(Gln) amidotransferase subunit B